MSRDLSELPDDRLLMMLGRYLKAAMSHPVGSALWADAVRGHADCQREIDGRLLARIVNATAERDGRMPGDSI